METREELIRKYADTCIELRNAELLRNKKPEEEKSFTDVLWDNRWKVLAGLVIAGGAGGTAYCYREEIKDYLEKDDNIFKEVNEFLSTNTGKAVVSIATAGSATAVKSNFTSNQTNVLKKMSDSELTPEFNYYRKLDPFHMSETELEYNITLMKGIIGSYKPTVAGTTDYTEPNDTSYLNKEPSFIKNLIDKCESDRKVNSTKDPFDKYFQDDDEEFILTEN